MASYLSGPFVGQTPQQSQGIIQFVRDNPRMVAETAIDFSPAGDIKALTYDLPRAIRAGNKLDAGIASLAVLPFVPKLDLFAYSPAKKQDIREAQFLVDTSADELRGYEQEYVEDVLNKVIAKKPRTATQALDADAARAKSDYETALELQERLGIEEPSLLSEFTLENPKYVHYSDKFFERADMDKLGLGMHLGTPEQALLRSSAMLRQNPVLAIDPVTGMPTVRAEQADFIMPEYVIRTGNILEMKDVGSHHNPFAVLNDLQNNPNLTREQRNLFRKANADLLEQYLQKVQDMRLGLRQSEAGLYVPDRLSSSLDLPIFSPADLGSGKMDYFNVPPESILSDTFVNKNVAQGAEKYTQAAIDDLLGYKEQFSADMPEQFTEELFNVTRGLADDAAYPLKEDYMKTGRKIFTEGQRAAQKVNIEQLKLIREKLQQLGFDTIKYENLGEVSPVFGRQTSLISLNPDANLKFSDARFFRPDIPDFRYAKGGIVNGYEQKKLS